MHAIFRFNSILVQTTLYPMSQSPPSKAFALHVIPFAALVICAFFVCFWNLGTASISSDDESIHVRVVQEMIQTHHWIFPTIDGEPYFGKPPFKLILSKIVVLLFGDSNLSFRILDGIAGFGTIILTFLLALRMFQSLPIAYTAALLLCINRVFLFKHVVRQAVQDSMLVFLSTAALLLAWELLTITNRDQVSAKRRRCGVLSLGIGLLSACAIWTKSVAGFFPVVILYPVLIMQLGVKSLLSAEHRVLLVPLFCAVFSAALYYGLAILFVPDAARQMLQINLYDRLLGSGFHNVDRWDLYLDLLLKKGSVAPPWLIVLGLLIGAIGCLRKEARYYFLITWILIPLVGFSALSSRLEWYLAPAFPAIALLCAAGFCSTVQTLWGIARMHPRAPARIAAGLIAPTLICYGAWNISATAADVVKRVTRDTKPRAIDLVCRAIRQELERSSSAGKVALFNLREALDKRNAPFNFHEKIYLGLLAPYTISVESEAELVALKASGALEFVFAPASQTKRLTELLSPCATRTLPGRPYRDTSERRSWPAMVVLALRNCDQRNAW